MLSGLASMGLEATQDPELQRMVQEYAETPPPQEERPAPQMPAAEMAAPAEMPEGPPKSSIMFEGREVEYDPSTDTYLELQTGRRVRDLEELTKPAAMYRGGLMDLMRKYG
jgi:hypothetical protein